MVRAHADDVYAAVRMLLAEFRLLEAADACELLARHSDPGGGREELEWWSRLAATVRAYRVAMLGTVRDGYGAIKRWAEVAPAQGHAPIRLVAADVSQIRRI